MRLTEAQRLEAKVELLWILKRKGELRAKQLIGTPKFHGERTLSLSQVLYLLRDLAHLGLVAYRPGGSSKRTYYLWRNTEPRM